MKKKNFFLLLILLLGLAGMGYGASKLLPIEQPSSENPSSETSVDDSGEIVNLNVINRHVLRAVNQTVVLTVTVLPENATDKTVVWSSSDTTKISITGTTANTATIKCLQTFNGSVVITARATNGTSDTADDFIATCTCTFLIPIETIDVQFVSPGTTSYAVGQKVNIKVLFTPIDANEVYNLTFNSTYLRNNGSHYDLGYTLTEEAKHHYEIEVLAPTPASTMTPITVTTDTTALTDSISVYAGYHLGQGRFLDTGLNIAVTQPGQSTVNFTCSTLEDYAAYDGKFAINTTVVITLPNYDFVSPAVLIEYNEMFFDLMGLTGSGVSSEESGVVNYSGLGGGTITLKVRAAGSNSNVVITATGYPTNNAYRTVQLPFGLKQPISGISIDIPEFDF